MGLSAMIGLQLAAAGDWGGGFSPIVKLLQNYPAVELQDLVMKAMHVRGASLRPRRKPCAATVDGSAAESGSSEPPRAEGGMGGA